MRAPLAKWLSEVCCRLIFVWFVVLTSCANPVSPSGGQVDRTPPVIETAEPPGNSVNVSPEAIRLTFSEYVDPTSFSRAFSITPEPEGRLDFRWRGRSVTVEVPESLRPNTTYILTMDSGLRDVNGVALKEPITLAFSTGPEINRGRIVGRVVGARRGEGVTGMDVFAYALRDSSVLTDLPDRPDYRTQTGPEGRFQFEYLSEEPYHIIALQDRNRNRKPDPLEAYAVPPHSAVHADSAGTEIEERWIATVLDTLPPELQRLRVLSSQRLELRFTEPVRLIDPDSVQWVVRDSLTGTTPNIRTVYRIPDAIDRIFALTDSLPDADYVLNPVGVVDSSGNPLINQEVRFQVTATPDTSVTRFRGFLPQGTVQPEGVFPLLPDEHPGVQFSVPVPDDRLRQIVSLQTPEGEEYSYQIQRAGAAFFFLPDSSLETPDSLVLRVDATSLSDTDSIYTQTYRRVVASELGELSGIVATPDATNVVVGLYPATENLLFEPRKVVADSTGRFVFRNLPEGYYHLRIFADLNEDLEWNGGRITPYQDAEPLGWSTDSLRVTPRWETAIEDTLKIPGLYL